MKLLLMLMLVVSLSGCATIFKGGHEAVSFSSEPSGVRVFINGMAMGKTPFKMKLESKKTYTIEFKQEGYETKTTILNNSVGAGWVILDILGGIIPVVIDAATGSWYVLDQDHVNALLEKQN